MSKTKSLEAVTPEQIARHVALLVEWADQHARSRRNDWPGLPITQVPVLMARPLAVAVDAGKVHIVTRPSTVHAGRTVQYIAPGSAS